MADSTLLEKIQKSKQSLSFEEADRLLRYEPNTGKIFWKIRVSYRIRSNLEAGYVHLGKKARTPYLHIRINKKLYAAHRIAWLLYYKVHADKIIDHINHDGLDNRIINLRVVSRHESDKNRALSKRNKSGFNGVRWEERLKKWGVSIRVNKKTIRLGWFADKNDAIQCRQNANIKYGFHPNHGNS